MEKKFKNGDIITDVFDTGIVKEYNKDTDTITFWIKISWNVDNPTIELNSVVSDIKHFTKAKPREKIKAINYLHREGYVWSEREGRVIDTYQIGPWDVIKNFLIENCWYINDTTGECFLFKEYISRNNTIISGFSLIDKDDFINIDVNDFKVEGTWRPARKSEEKKLFERLNRVGYLWDEVTHQLMYVGEYYPEKQEFNDGDFIVNETTNEISILKEQDYFIVCDDKSYTAYYRPWVTMKLNNKGSVKLTKEKISMYNTLRYATLPEINDFLQFLKDNGYTWNNKTKQLIKSK